MFLRWTLAVFVAVATVSIYRALFSLSMGPMEDTVVHHRQDSAFNHDQMGLSSFNERNRFPSFSTNVVDVGADSDSNSSYIQRYTTAICVIFKDEHDYVEEWVSYHFALGFSHIYIYDNSIDPTRLQRWNDRRQIPNLRVVEYPGTNVDIPAYKACAQQVVEKEHTWLTFLDMDEFFVLKFHTNVLDFAEEYATDGQVAINTQLFGHSGQGFYEPLPVTLRFQCRLLSAKNKLIRSFIRIRDLGKIGKFRSTRTFPLQDGKYLIDTNGEKVQKMQHDGPRNVVLVYKYLFRSIQEFGQREEYKDGNLQELVKLGWDYETGTRFEPEGRIAQMCREGLDTRNGEAIKPGSIHDDNAWKTMKRLVPKYESLENSLRHKATCDDATRYEKDHVGADLLPSAALCAVHREDHRIVDEFVDYHLALGFHKILLFDNSASPDKLKRWGNRKQNPQVTVIRLTGSDADAVRDCIQRVKKHHQVVSFLDVDEYLILKNHTNVLAFAEDYVQEGQVAINTQVFGTSGRTIYEPFPLAMRFQCRLSTSMNKLVRSISRVSDLGNMDQNKGTRTLPLRDGAFTVDTDGTKVNSIKHKGPRNVALIYKFHYRSNEEFLQKGQPNDIIVEEEESIRAQTKLGVDPRTGERLRAGTIRDDTAWKKLKRLVPEYAKNEKKVPEERAECDQPNQYDLSVVAADLNEGIARLEPRSNGSAVLCVVHTNDFRYLTEWADYHLALGFSDIYLYDNTAQASYMQRWKQGTKEPRIHVKSFVGENVQVAANMDCAQTVKKLKHTWVMFLDIDEFLILKKHESILKFAREHADEGQVAVNRQVFGTSGRTFFEPWPVTRRFQCQVDTSMNDLVKPLIRVRDLGSVEEMEKSGIPFRYPTRQGTFVKDTDGNTVVGGRHRGPRDVALIYHYRYLSKQEFTEKKANGYFGSEEDLANVKPGLDPETGEKPPNGETMDGSAWEILKLIAPQYKRYEHILPFESTVCKMAEIVEEG